MSKHLTGIKQTKLKLKLKLNKFKMLLNRFKLFLIYSQIKISCNTSFSNFLSLMFFQFTGIESVKGLTCQKYVRKIVEFNKTNTYTFYISQSKPHVPVKYEMIGYDNLLKSHYDHYILDYITFHPWAFNFSFFKIPTGRQNLILSFCFGYICFFIPSFF